MRSDSTACAALDTCSNATSARPRNTIAGSHPLLPDGGEPDRRHPRFLGPADAAAGNLDVEEIRLAVDGVRTRARQRLAQLRRALHHLAGDAEAAGNIGHVHVGIAEIVVDELSGLHHAAARY